MTVAATLYTQNPDERRDSARRAVARDTTLRDETSLPMAVVVEDLSQDGFRVETNADLALDAPVRIGLSGIGTREARVVRRDGQHYGCRFDQPLDLDTFYNAFLREPVVQGGFPAHSASTGDLLADFEVRKWHPALRLTFLIGAATSLWMAILRLF